MGSAWLDHVKKTIRLHPGKPLKEVLKVAKKTYKKTAAVVTGKKVHKKTAKKSHKKSAKKHHKKSAKKSHKKRGKKSAKKTRRSRRR